MISGHLYTAVIDLYLGFLPTARTVQRTHSEEAVLAVSNVASTRRC